MSLLNLTPPSIGQPNATEDVDTVNAFNAVQTLINGNLDEPNLTTPFLQRLGLNGSGTVGRGASVIAATESRTNVAYGTLTTPDQVAGVVVPTNGLIIVAYQATWQNSVANAGRAAIFIGANQLKYADGPTGGAPIVQEATMVTALVNQDAVLASYPNGLISPNWNAGVPYTGDVTTGQVIGSSGSSGMCAIFAAAGTYTVSVQFKSASGSVTAKNRRLYVWVVGF